MLNINDYDLVDFSNAYSELVYHWRNSEHVRRYMFNDLPISIEEHLHWVQKSLTNNTSCLKLLLFQSVPIGYVGFTQIDTTSGRCNWGFYIGSSDAPKGSGMIMGILSLTYIFENVGLHKVCSEVLAYNTRSIAYHQRLGFIEEGRLHEHILRDDHYEDVILMALFRSKWERRKEEIKREWGGM